MIGMNTLYSYFYSYLARKVQVALYMFSIRKSVLFAKDKYLISPTMFLICLGFVFYAWALSTCLYKFKG